MKIHSHGIQVIVKNHSINQKQMKQMKEMVEKEQELLLHQVDLWNKATMSSDAIIDRFKTQKIEEYMDLVFG